MHIDIACSPSYSVAYCYLNHKESVLVESGGMAYMSAGIAVSAGVSGSLASAVGRKLIGGESFFMGRYTANVDGAWVACAPQFPGDIAVEHLSGGDDLLIETGSLLAASEGIDIDVKFSGVSAMVLREGAAMLRCSGAGDLVLSSYGGIQRFVLSPGESLIVDTGHLVGFSAGMKNKAGPLTALATSAIVGEGFVAAFEGPGIVLTQTRSEQGMKQWLFPTRQQNSG